MPHPLWWLRGGMFQGAQGFPDFFSLGCRGSDAGVSSMTWDNIPGVGQHLLIVGTGQGTVPAGGDEVIAVLNSDVALTKDAQHVNAANAAKNASRILNLDGLQVARDASVGIPAQQRSGFFGFIIRYSKPNQQVGFGAAAASDTLVSLVLGHSPQVGPVNRIDLDPDGIGSLWDIHSNACLYMIQ